MPARAGWRQDYADLKRAARAYATIKEQLATRFPRDADAYDDIKDPVCDLIMAGAEEWAQRTGWQEPPAD